MTFSLQSQSVLVVLFLSECCEKSDKGELHADMKEGNIFCGQTTVSDKIYPFTSQILKHEKKLCMSHVPNKVFCIKIWLCNVRQLLPTR